MAGRVANDTRHTRRAPRDLRALRASWNRFRLRSAAAHAGVIVIEGEHALVGRILGAMHARIAWAQVAVVHVVGCLGGAHGLLGAAPRPVLTVAGHHHPFFA